MSGRAGTQGSRTRDGVADNCSWDRIVTSTPGLPPAKDDPDEDEAQLTAFPWAEPPFKVDYCGRISCVSSIFPCFTRLTTSAVYYSIGENSFFNFNFIVLNTCEVRIGSRCLFGPNVSLYDSAAMSFKEPHSDRPLIVACLFSPHPQLCGNSSTRPCSPERHCRPRGRRTDHDR